MYLSVRDIPNIICIARIILIVPIVLGLLAGNFGLALFLFVIAGISDGLDGFLARHYHWRSRLGSFLDPLADKLLIVCVYITFAWLDLMPVWFISAAIIRDVIIILGAIGFHHQYGPYHGEPLWSSKLNTVLQIALVIAILADQSLIPLPGNLINLLLIATLLTILWSGVAYVYIWGRRAIQLSSKKIN